jgi:hypothetical protein
MIAFAFLQHLRKTENKAAAYQVAALADAPRSPKAPRSATCSAYPVSSMSSVGARARTNLMWRSSAR